ITAGWIASDGAWNIVPRQVRLRGSIRSFTSQLRQTALTRLRELAGRTSTSFGVEAVVKFPFFTPPLINHPEVTSTILEIGRELVGEQASELPRPLTVSDDMAEFLDQIPGCYFMLGAAPSETDPPAAHHSPTFRIDESALELGVRMLGGSAVRLAAGVSIS
ncbi:MAG: M20/M25/M40 family metallo-hydrolase, partial [Candidatus Dormibacteraceae bacterium]